MDVRGDDECWLWTGHKSGKPGNTYGQIRVVDKRRGAHIVALELAGHERKPGQHACHRCNNSLCVNARHLYFGTPTQNAEDRQRSNRNNRGERNGQSRLSAPQVVEIRERYAAGEPGKALAVAFDIAESSVASIVTGKNWPNVGGPITFRRATRWVSGSSPRYERRRVRRVVEIGKPVSRGQKAPMQVD